MIQTKLSQTYSAHLRSKSFSRSQRIERLIDLWQYTCLALLVLVSACASPSTENDTTRAVCQDVSSLSRDRSNGILSPTEIREKAQAIHQQAQTSKSPAVTKASEELLRELTTGEPEKVSERLVALLTACDAALTVK